MTDRLRAVLDTDVFLCAFLSRNPTSPTKEVIQRWQAGEFVLLVSDKLVEELAEKLLERKIDPALVTEFLALLAELAEWIDVPEDAVQPVVPTFSEDSLSPIERSVFNNWVASSTAGVELANFK